MNREDVRDIIVWGGSFYLGLAIFIALVLWAGPGYAIAALLAFIGTLVWWDVSR